MAMLADDLTGRWINSPDPVEYSNRAGLPPDPWQETVLTSKAPRIIMLCSRQSGKSATAGTLAMWTAQFCPRSLILIGAPSQNQSAELLLKAKGVYNVAGPTIESEQDAVLRMKLDNGSRIICVPGRNGTVRAYSAVKLLIVDEAAYVTDEFYQAVFPMLAVSKGRMVLLSTPHAKQGAFYEIWTNAPNYDPRLPVEQQEDAWLKVKVPWRDCPRISPSVVAEYARTYGDHSAMREFECEFRDTIDSVFTREEVDAMDKPDIEQWDDLW